MTDNGGISIVIPAFREENNIEAAIDNAARVAASVTQDYEIIVVDDGSLDKTGEFARLRAETNPKVRVTSNARNEGFGYSFAKGVQLASKTYVTVFPGDNDMSADSLRDLMLARGGAEIIISYMRKTTNRSLGRRLLSHAFVGVMNLLFGLKLKYYNGAFICQTKLLRSVPIKSTGLAALAECIVRLLKKGCSYKTIYFEHIGRKHHQSKALNLRSFKTVAKTIGLLVKDIYWPAKNPS